ncbi:MAG: pre-peptidase C-terminal domain-containing protein [Verrucomicrobiae bacterium]|nr:pre-peptidase C-terminal domain-containing protein [Verrucomicrobiae bacterium]
MNRLPSRLLLAALIFPAAARAQLPSAELQTLNPPVIRAGETTTVTVGGLNLEELTGLAFSNPGIKAEVVAGTKQFRVTVPVEAPEGPVEVRADGYFGRSTSRFLTIAAKETPVVADSGTANHDPVTAPALPLEAVAYGSTDANQIDRWKLPLTKGQHILVHCRSERIDSRADASLILTDSQGKVIATNHNAVGRDPLLDFTAPADGDYLVGVHDFLYNGGAEYTYLLTATTRPWIDAVFPPAGQEGQALEATLLGRNLPGGSPGEGLLLDGQPLETLNVRIPVPAPEGPAPDPATPARAMLPGFTFSHEGSNPVRIGVTSLPVVSETNDGELPPLNVPCEVAARFDQDGDSDAFRFSAKANTAYWIEVTGDRIAGTVDPYLVIEKITKGADGKETLAVVREGDDTASKGGTRLQTGSRDATLSLAPGEASDYRITVVNQFVSGGPTHLYRLAIREAKPDFELFAVQERSHYEKTETHPAATLLRKGGTEPIRVHIYRRDGFDAPITLEATGLPAGVTCPPVTASLKEDSVRLVFQATPDAAGWNGDIHIIGKSRSGEAEVVREARGASFVQGAADTAKERLRPRLGATIPLSVSATEKAPVSLEVGNGGRFAVEMGGKLEIPVKIAARNGVKGALVLTADGLQGLRQSPTLSLAEKTDEGKMTLTFTPQNNVFTPEAGTWTFVLKAVGTTSYRRMPEAAEAAAAALKQADEALKNAKPEEKDALTKAKAAAEAKSKAAAAAAAPKDVKFSAYTLPIVVEVKAPPKKDS